MVQLYLLVGVTSVAIMPIVIDDLDNVPYLL
jgi:hypothetical protein